jgi:phosphoglycerol transferase MdoB-like AlkP superfamily enzyme
MNKNTAAAIPTYGNSTTWEALTVYKDEGGEDFPDKDEIHIFCNQEVSDQAVSLVIEYASDEFVGPKKAKARLEAMKKIGEEIAFRLNFFNRTSATK